MICPSCSEFFKNPKYLPCHHSYCEECLEKMQEHSKIICLKCANTIDVPIGGIKNLPYNYFMDNLINKVILNYKLKNEKELKCEECDEDDPVVAYCTDCKLFFCCYCKESHKYNKSHCTHNLISLAEMKSNKDLIRSKCKFPKCQEHDLELEHYCESCEKLVCVQCTAEHEGHKCDAVKNLAKKYQNQLKEITASIENISKNVSKLNDSIEEVRMAIKHQGAEITKEIDLCYDKVFQELLEQKQRVKQQVCDTLLQKEKVLTEQLEEVMQIQKDIFIVRNNTEEISDQELLSESSQLLYSCNALREKYENLGSEPREAPNITIIPGNDPVPQVVKHFATTDSPSFEVKLFKNPVQRYQTVTLAITRKDGKGECYPKYEVKAIAVETRTGEQTHAKIADNYDGTYTIYF